MLLKTKLWSHQQQMHDFALKSFQEFGYVYWIAGMAVGKTATALAVATSIEAHRTLVITTKAALESTWPSEVTTHTSGVACMPLLRGSSATKAQDMLTRCKGNEPFLIVVVNYETAREIGDAIAKVGFNLVVADECHKLKNSTSKTLKILAKACKNIPAKIGMTGTAFNDKPTDVFGQLAFLDPTFYGGHVGSNVFGRWGEFFDAYTTYYVANNIKIATGYKNIDKLKDTINPFTFYVDTEKVLDLPPVRYIRRTVQASKQLRLAYDQMANEMVAHFGDKLAVADTVLTQALRLAQMTGGYATPYHIDTLGNYVATGERIEIENGDCKLQALLDIMDEVGNEPVVVFTRFTSDLERVANALHKLGYEVLELSGRIHQHVAFQSGKGQVLVANMSAGSTGITLTRAHLVIDFSLGYSRTEYDQSRYRVRRPDSDKNTPVTYYQIVVADTIDEIILDALQAKGDVADMLRIGLTNGVKIAS